MKTTAVILAAGQGTRMRSKLPKVLHPILGRPMLQLALEAVRQATDDLPVVIIGHGAEEIGRMFHDEARFALQEPQLGTGHAVQQAHQLLGGQTDQVLVTTADMPLLTSATLHELVEAQSKYSGPISMLTLQADDPRGFGRIVRNDGGQVQRIVEEAQASTDQLAIRELNASVYCFRADWLWPALARISLSPKGEYYLTDLVGIAVEDGLSVQAMLVSDPDETIGVNTRIHLAEAETVLRRRINQQWMLSGVSIIDPSSTYIEPGVTIGMDTVIWPNTYLQGATTIGESCVIGPNTIVNSTRIGNDCKIIASVLEYARLEDDVSVGPFGHLRKGAHLAEGVHMGNFGEVKDSYLGPGTKMGHFSYIGNAAIGAEVNIGAGTITCNYDGKLKHKTEIGDEVFIGSDTMLVAPVTVGRGARTGAGAVVTKNVPPHTLAVGLPARVIRKLE
jgi:bifunctional UDP-N-acetylglucosamine pyrophosphorylase/glucosamine-1-phosphate N-acetyltransferase